MDSDRPLSPRLLRRGSRAGAGRRAVLGVLALVLAAGLLGAGCSSSGSPGSADPAPGDSLSRTAFLDTVQSRTFDFFWETTPAETGLTPDRWPDPPFSSVAAVGFALTAYPIGVERGYVSRREARERTLQTLRFFWNAPQGPAPTGVMGHRGFFYHFVDMQTGERFQQVELSTIDTGLFLMGARLAAQYFDGDHAQEEEIRALTDSLTRRVEWDWMQLDDGLVSMGWKPEEGRFDYGYEGYDEAMFLYVLALGSPTHPVSEDAWPAFTSTYDWASFYGQKHVNFAPLFGHQYSHVWIDYRDIQDEYMREKGIDYFENSRRAVLAQQAYAEDNPEGYRGYGEHVWGWTASDGPGDTTATIRGRERSFRGYWARGVAKGDLRDDGTIAPTAAGGSVPFAPEITIPTLRTFYERGEPLFDRYGFRDAFNQTYTLDELPPDGGFMTPEGWVDNHHLGIDQGPILAMIENHRSGMIWRLMRQDPVIVRGLCRAGFSGGWLEGRCPSGDGS
jgi:hypothetical protein